MHRDSALQPIAVGDKVAYNMSGNVMLGRVVELCPGHIKVALDHQHHSNVGPWVKRPHISKVRNGASMVVLPS